MTRVKFTKQSNLKRNKLLTDQQGDTAKKSCGSVWDHDDRIICC
jgi:hypothetical protein